MSVSIASLGIDRLSLAEKLQLVEELWDDISAEAEAADIPESHKQELDRRIAAYEADPKAGSSWQEVKARLRNTTGNSA